MTKQSVCILKQSLWACFFLSAHISSARAFNSGSTGIDGAFSPNVNTTIQLPQDGILNYTTFNIPAGVTVKFQSNAENTPAYILVQGDAFIDGTIDVSGINGDVLTSLPPGGYAGGAAENAQGLGKGQGAGGGSGGLNRSGSGGSYGSLGLQGGGNSTVTGKIYGAVTVQPLFGGSGGGGVGSFDNSLTLRGGSGAGALLLASSGVLSLNGAILAVGGKGVPETEIATTLYASGGGSGGGIRLVATTLTGVGIINISGGIGGDGSSQFTGAGGNGGIGRARLEADILNFSGVVLPNAVTTSLPQPVFLAVLPSVRITSVAGSPVPANPDGENDVVLSSSSAGIVTVQLAATDVPLGTTIAVTNRSGAVTTSTPLIGTVANSTATAQVSLGAGANRLFASVSFQ